MAFTLKKVNDKTSTIPKYNKKIVYGVPAVTAESRTDDAINNANILAIMEAGSIVNNLPKRKLLEQIPKVHRAEIDIAFHKILEQLMLGNEEEADKLMNRLAFRVETWTKAFFIEDNGWAPNAPITVKGGWMKNKVTGKPIYIKGKGSDKPLIDTGELRKAIRGMVVKD